MDKINQGGLTKSSQEDLHNGRGNPNRLGRFWARVIDHLHSDFKLEFSLLLAYPLAVDLPIPQPIVPVQIERINPWDQAAIAELMQMYQVCACEEGILQRMNAGHLC